jgi:ribonuclease P protein component
MPFPFPPSARLHDDRDYSRVFNRQQKAAGRAVVVLVRPRNPGPGGRAASGRLGVMISVKAVKTAVRRHQLKRWVRELFRLRLAAVLAGHDAVVMFRSDHQGDHPALDAEIAALASRAIAASSQPRPPRGRRR